MQVQWKMLFSLGLLFWATMCSIDHIFGNIINSGEFSKLTEVETETIVDDVISRTASYRMIGWKQIVAWSVFSFFSSFILCFVVKLIQISIKKRSELKVVEEEEEVEVITLVEPTTQEETLVEAPSIDLETPVKAAKVSVGTCVTPEQSEQSISTHNILESKYATSPQKYNDITNEHVNNTIKKVIAKKLEAFNKEKRELAKKMSDIQKENKQIKEQLDDILTDRTLLIKRLECATREIKLNTSSKQVTLDKLEQAITCSNELKTKLFRANEERMAIQEKYKSLEAQHKCLLDELNRKEEAFQEKLKMQSQTSSETKQSEEDIPESEDMQKVQTKLDDLEKSLEKMKLMTSKTTVDYDTFSLQSTDSISIYNANEHQSTTESGVQDDCTTSMELPSHFGCGDEQILTVTTFKQRAEEKSKSEEPHLHAEIVGTAPVCKDIKSDDDTTEKEITSITSNNEILLKYNEEDGCLKMVDYSLSSSDTSTSSSIPTTETTSVETMATDAEYEILYTPGILSQSPAFQQFLLKVMDTSSENSMVSGKNLCPITTK